MITRPTSQTKTQISVFEGGTSSRRSDRVVTEEPLEVRAVVAGESRSIAVTMRTPGRDFELAAGFLFGEGIISGHGPIRSISYCRDDDLPEEQLYNIVIVELTGDVEIDARRIERHFHVSSACGVCGKSSLEAISLRGIGSLEEGPRVGYDTIVSLPERLRAEQSLFETTGGLHAAALFSPEGDIQIVREDVGRHNAVDKLVGWALLREMVPLEQTIMLVSGRSSFEILQKAAAARIPIVCSVSAPSSLAVDVAKTFGITLIGFLREKRFNVYSGEERISD